MSIYRLWRELDDKSFDDIEARDNEHALEVFGQQLGITLTLKEAPAAPQYMMGRIEKWAGWTKKPDIAVYETPKHSI
jgi:hypothetical protein